MPISWIYAINVGLVPSSIWVASKSLVLRSYIYTLSVGFVPDVCVS